MTRLGTLAVLTGCLTSALPAQAQRFTWEKGAVLTYRVEHIATIRDESESTKLKATTKLNETKRWQVLDVDKAGVGTLQLSLTAMRLELTRTDGESLLFDSNAFDRSTPQMREQLSKFLNVPLAVLRVDRSGKVLEVKQTKSGPASRYEAEPPFVIVLPADGQAASEWERAYQITLEPPQGTGEKFAAVQKYRVDASTRAIELSTIVKNPPAAAADRVPLLQFQPTGRVTFDVSKGRMQRAELKIDQEIKDYQGAGSSYRLTSTYTEELVGN